MGLLEALPKFARLNRLVRATLLTDSCDEEELIKEVRKQPVNEDIRNVKDANLITSESRPGRHIPVLDIDFEAALIPSTTEGHYHLYLDVEMPWPKYVALLEALNAAGIIQDGFLAGAKERGYSSLRLPHIDKNNHEQNVADPEHYRKLMAEREREVKLEVMAGYLNTLGGLIGSAKWTPEKLEKVIIALMEQPEPSGDFKPSLQAEFDTAMQG